MACLAAHLANVMVCPCKFLCKKLVLGLEFFNDFSFWVIILERCVSDLCRLRSIGQGTLVLLKVAIGRVKTSDHTTEAVPSKALLQEAC